MDKILGELTAKLKQALSPGRIVSVVLYGSAAAGDYHGPYSDLNILCVLDRVTPEELHAAGPVFHWWREQGNPAPLLLSLEELRNSTDCFPIEFHDIREAHRVLEGEDVVAALVIDDSFYRAQVEHELRAKLLRLRQKAAGVMAEKDLLLRLLIDSVSTFCVLLRHALLLHGRTVGTQKRDIVAEAARAFALEASPFDTLLDLRERKRKPGDVAPPAQLLEQYLESIRTAIDAVDRLEKKS